MTGLITHRTSVLPTQNSGTSWKRWQKGFANWRIDRSIVGLVLWSLHVHCNQEHTAIATAYMTHKKIEREDRNKEKQRWKTQWWGRLTGKMGVWKDGVEMGRILGGEWDHSVLYIVWYYEFDYINKVLILLQAKAITQWINKYKIRELAYGQNSPEWTSAGTTTSIWFE